MTNLHMKTANQAYGDFEYVSGNYRNINQPIYMTTVPPVVADAFRQWKHEWLPTTNHDYGHFYGVLDQRCRSQKMKTPDAWSYNIHPGCYTNIKCKDPECLKDTCTTSCLAENHRNYKRLDKNRLKMTEITSLSVDIIDNDGRKTSIGPSDDGYHNIVRPCTKRTLTANDISRVNICMTNQDGSRFRMSTIPRFFHFASLPNQSKSRMRSTYPEVIHHSKLF